MKPTHVVPEPSIFAPLVRKLADELGHRCHIYALTGNPLRQFRDLLRLYDLCRKAPGSLYVFHWVPHYRIALLRLLLREFHYALIYWGEDYYSSFLEQNRFERHCLGKSPLLDRRLYRTPAPSRVRRWRRAFRLRIGLVVVSGAEAILSLTRKQFRILRLFHCRLFGTALATPRWLTIGYSPEPELLAQQSPCNGMADTISILVCHSATAAVAHEQALELARRYQQRWNVKVQLNGFLSYSGGSEADRDALEARLRAKAGFAESIDFERRFCSPTELQKRLGSMDIAVFCCLRDEAVGLLTLFARMGGLLAFNRYSFNYDFFDEVYPEKLLSHEQFMEMPPAQIRARRGERVDRERHLLEFRQLESLTLRKY